MTTEILDLPDDEVWIVGELREFGSSDEWAWIHQLAMDVANLIPDTLEGFLQSVKISRSGFRICVRCEDAHNARAAIREELVLRDFPLDTVRYHVYLIPMQMRDIESERCDTDCRTIEDDPVFGDCARLTRLDKLRPSSNSTE